MCELFTAGLAGPEGFQRTFVLKRLKPELARNRAAVDQFIDEAKLGSTLVHSNIVPVFDFGRVGDGYFIAQEYIVGRNVAQISERHIERLREPLDVAERPLHRLRDAAGARLRARARPTTTASRCTSSTATSRPATSW